MRWGIHKKPLKSYYDTKEYRVFHILMAMIMAYIAALKGYGFIGTLISAMIFAVIVNGILSYVRDWEIHRQQWQWQWQSRQTNTQKELDSIT